MAEKRTSAKGATAHDGGLSAAERQAVKDLAAERRAAKKGSSPADGEAAVQEKLAEMPEPDRALLTRLHELVREAAPDLVPRTWYGMPAYSKGGKVLCWLKPATKFGSRYATVGFSDVAALDDGAMWPTEYAVTTLDGGVERRFTELVRQAAGG